MEYKVEINGLTVNAVYREKTVNTVFMPLISRLEAMQREKQRRIKIQHYVNTKKQTSQICF